MIKSKKLLLKNRISHGFFNRIGGKSTGIFKSLNCGPGSIDKMKNVQKNLRIVKNKISKKSKDIFLTHHLNNLKYFDQPSTSYQYIFYCLDPTHKFF